nr:retrovirus-related Pol polyprotein from transposon TNT 1-94 [Tanacetum cinerariifolium]
IADGLDHVNPVVRLPIEQGIIIGTRVGKRLLYVKGNKAISLGKGASKVSIELQHLSLKDCTNTNHVEDYELASLFGKLKYEENLIDNIYETKKKKSLSTATPLSNAFISTSIVHDFQDNLDDGEDRRSSQKYMNDLEQEFHERALLANSKRTKVLLLKHMNGMKKMCHLMTIMVEVKVLMVLVDDENVIVGKERVTNGEWVKVSIRKVHTLLEMEDNDKRKAFIDYLSIDLNYVEKQRNNLVLKHRDLVQELNTCDDIK